MNRYPGGWNFQVHGTIADAEGVQRQVKRSLQLSRRELVVPRLRSLFFVTLHTPVVSEYFVPALFALAPFLLWLARMLQGDPVSPPDWSGEEPRPRLM